MHLVSPCFLSFFLLTDAKKQQLLTQLRQRIEAEQTVSRQLEKLLQQSLLVQMPSLDSSRLMAKQKIQNAVPLPTNGRQGSSHPQSGAGKAIAIATRRTGLR